MMSDKEKAIIKAKILDLISQSEKDIIEIKKSTKPISPENSIGRVSRMDAINNKSVMEAALRKKKEKLSKLKIALSKIDMPDFGICARCSSPIQQGRLIFMPESSRCIRCADR